MTGGLPSTARRWLLAVALLVQFMVALDVSVVNVALADIHAALDFTADGLVWVVDAYTLTFGGLIMLGSRIGDVTGRRRTLLAGLMIFGLASLAGGLARGPGELIAARAAQGVGAAVLAPMAFTLITAHVPAGPARARALGLWGAAAALGGAAGVLAGGVLTEWASWRSVLFVNVPVVAFAMVAARQIPADQRRSLRPRLDIAGALLATAGTSTLVLGVVRTQAYGWSSAATVLTLALAAALLAVFVLVERRAAAPLLDLRLLAHRPVLGANLCVLLLFSGQFAAFYFVSLYVQQVLGFGPAATGLAFLPFALGTVAGTIIATRTIARIGPRWLLSVGSAVAAAGFGWFAVALKVDGSFLTSILGPSLVASISLGVCFVPAGTTATTGIDPAEAGMASGLITSSRQIGGSIGLAALATVSITVTNHHHGGHLAALATGYATAVGIGAALLALASVVALLLIPGRPQPDATPTAPRPGRALTR